MNESMESRMKTLETGVMDVFKETVVLRSGFLRGILYEIDDRLCLQREKIEWQEKKIKELQDKLFKIQHEAIQDGQKKMANTLVAMLDASVDVGTIGAVGATMLARIRNMQTIEEVHDYIKKTFDHNKKKHKKSTNTKKIKKQGGKQ